MGRLIDYPRAGKSGARRFLPSWKLVLGTAAGAVLLAVIGFSVVYAKVSVPDPNTLVTAQASVVYWADGRTELGRFSEVNRRSVPLSAVPEHVQKAVLAAEDRSFETNKGISPKGIGRAVVVKIKGGSTQGGSTITQQYVKNYFLTQDRTASRKIKEFVISLKIEQEETKDKILENYLNTIYFGRGAYGIETASQAYFGRPASRLTVSQGAVLASIIRSPGLYDPVEAPERLQGRVDYVLDGMVEQGWLSQEERDRQRMPKVVKRKKADSRGGTNGYLLETVRLELRDKAGLTDADIDRGGLKIVSTFDRKAQASAVEAMREEMPTTGAKGVRAGLVAVKPGDGAVVAMYGGKDSVKQSFNAATQATMQAGSTFKPFALAAALEDGVSLRSRFDGSSPRRFGEDSIDNFGGRSYGRIDLIKATASSVNTVYVDLNQQIGPEKTRQAAIRAGYPKDTQDLKDNIGNVLGTASPRVIDVAESFATFAALGQHADPYTVRRVTGADGRTAYKADVRPQRVFSTDAMRDLTYALQGVVESGSGAYAGSNLGRPAAGKTGTSQSNRSAWFAGFTPQLSAAVGLYRGGSGGTTESLNGLGGLAEVTGASFPVKIWTAFMKGALEGTEVRDFPPPVYGGKSNVPTATATHTSSTPTRSTSPTTTTATTPAPPTTPSSAPSTSTTTEPTPTQTKPTVSATTPTLPTVPTPPTMTPTTSVPPDGGGGGRRGGTGTATPEG